MFVDQQTFRERLEHFLPAFADFLPLSAVEENERLLR